jgi:hypothetical protein
MYSTCIFCHSRLGENQSLEHLPVGKVIAFDPVRGRLWVVCGTCRQWNLSPFDGRWEAIEEAERIFRDTRLRASTGEIGLARLRAGTELVRVGKPLLPEFAAWRYGDRFKTRWVRHGVAGVATFAIGFSVGPLLGISVGTAPFLIVDAARKRLMLPRFAARIERSGAPRFVSHAEAAGVRIEAAPRDPLGWRLLLPVASEWWRYRGVSHDDEIPSRLRLEGAHALDALRQLLPQVNASGGRPSHVRAAVGLLEEKGDLRGAVTHAAGVTEDLKRRNSRAGLAALPTALRLALEMAAHEDVERRALEGELAALEAEWRAAEEIAAIADTLTLPEWMADRLGRLGRG